MHEEAIIEGISSLAKLIKKRVELYGEKFLYNSQESLITFLYVYSLVSQNPDLLDKIYLDYPFSKQLGSRGKFDIYIDVNPGYYFEVKYIRPIPSGRNLPLPQHRGSLIDDLIRLATRTSPESNKYLLLVATQEFIKHLTKKPGFPLTKNIWHGAIRELIVTNTEENRISPGNRRHLEYKVGLELRSHKIVYPFHIILWRVLP